MRGRIKFKKNIIVRKPKKDRADVLLIYPIWAVHGGKGKLQRMLPPMGILSIASYLEEHGYEVHVVDLHAEMMTKSNFRKILQSLKPKIIGISVLSAHVKTAHLIAQICKEEVDDCKLIVGGVHAEVESEGMLRNSCIDAVCRGDGEETMFEFVNGVPYKDILGLVYKKENNIVHNLPRPVEMNLDQYPIPAYHLIDFDHYFPPVSSYKELPAMNVLMTRGCPGKCTFCNSAKTVLRSRSAKSMVQMIKHLRYTYGIRQIYFYDDTFTAQTRVVKEFCSLMINDKVDVKWICYVRGDMFRYELASLMKQAGCHQVLIGIESGSATLMKDIGKPIQKKIYIEAVKIAHQCGIEVRGSFIIGHINETQETMRETVDFAKEMDIDFFQLSLLTPYPGTALFRQAKQESRLLHQDYEEYGQELPVLKLNNLSPKQVVKFNRLAFRKFYFRPKIIWRMIRRLRRWAQFKDLVRAFYMIFISNIRPGQGKILSQWLEFDLENRLAKSTMSYDHLTYEVRQSNDLINSSQTMNRQANMRGGLNL